MKMSRRGTQGTLALLSIVCQIMTLPVLAKDSEPSNVQRRFRSPEEAIQALKAATQAKDKTALHAIFGPSVDQMLTRDEAQDAANFNAFTRSVGDQCVPIAEGQNKLILEIGADRWPFPIPLINENGSWLFDTNAGKEEIICRHIGRDELHAIGLCRAYVDAQRGFAEQHRDREGGKAYALHFKSLPKDLDLSGNGAMTTLKVDDLLDVTEPRTLSKRGDTDRTFYGYRFKILTRQGRDASRGKLDYVVHGKLARGFGLVAYPTHWGKSGIMTFIVNQDGKLYQRNLGEKTVTLASALTEYNPTSEWRLVKEPGVVDWMTMSGR